MKKLDRILTKFILSKKRQIVFEGKSIFTMRNFGDITNMRIETFATKEPETLNWIKNFKKEDTLLDIGANVGIYSLYAASRGHKIVSIEPDALNFALLNLNIKDNEFNRQITAFPYSVHEKSKPSILNIHRYYWGGTASSFDRSLDWKGENMSPVFKQGSPGISVDDFIEGCNFFPNHIKIDIDGNEFLVLCGATKTLNNPNCKSVLIELFEGHPEYQQCIEIFKKNGFVLSIKTHAPMFDDVLVQAENHIFVKH
ncbi:MAG TPA: FkbM family methyltransferase [Gammaproteobacteria bacterium]|nr:FkbM family methyltransferase [Gammaproteobacteria bacterium]